MSILMSSMSSFSHYDPFNTQSYLFDNNQEHYLQPLTGPPTSYATPHQFPVDPRWFNNSFSAHPTTTAAPHQFSPMTHSVITPPHLQTDLHSLSPSSTITPIPPLSGSRNRSRSMSNRIRSFNSSSTRPQQRPSSGSARGGAQNTQRIARRSTVSSSSPSLGHHHQHQHPSPTMGGMQSSSPSTTSYLHSPTTLEHEPDSHETRASKRRRTDDVDSASLHSYSTVPEPPHLLSPPPHLALLHHHHHGYPPSQTWAGPPSAGHGVSPDHHGYTQWPPAPLYFTPDQQQQGLGDHHQQHLLQHLQQHQHLHQPHQLSATSDASHTPILPYPSPTVAGPGFYSPEPEAPVSAVSTQFQFHKMEPDSPRLMDDVVVVQPSFDSFEHGPTEFPPRAYPGGVDAKSPWVPTKPVGKIFGSRLEQVGFFPSFI
jgi:hypothetical protein